MSFPEVSQQLEIIRRGVEKIVPEAELAEKLKKSRETGVPLRVKYGIDPTGIDVHLGHTVPLRKLRQFQELGHQAVIIIGNATAMVGDPSGRDQARAKRLSAEDVEANARDYLTQVGKVVDLSKAEVHRNGDWFGKMSFADILNLCGKVTVAQLLTRDDFAKRMAASSPIFLHECLYPIMQAWDSVMIKSDIELGGTEQLYSFMLARDLQRADGLGEQIGVMSPILVGLDGVRRMGKSLGNYIGINEPAYEMMKKFMQLPDACMKMFYELLTEIPIPEVESLLAGHPKECKTTLARNVIAQYHGAAAAEEAAARWQREIGEGALPADIPTATLRKGDLQDGGIQAAQLLKSIGLCPSTSDARRAIQQGGAFAGEEKTPMTAHDQLIPIATGLLVWVGKKRVKRIELVD
ncbi:MAG TPA: tyrosine--tRNA ligase [Caulifigura sp.]|jgi:tyrosyl-tRNA synthetase|nr:tyrosine--tRNA ligase [Caulifigura sp.]